MNTKALIPFAAGALCAASLGLLIAAGPGDDKARDIVTPEEMELMKNMSPEDMMASMTKLSTPGAYHQRLYRYVGQWDAKGEFMMEEDAPPVVSMGTMEVEQVLDGRFIESTVKMDFMGQPFHGIGYTGYSNFHDRYVSSWMDTMSTNIMHMTGTVEDGKMVLKGAATTPMGENMMKMVTEYKSDDQLVDKFYDQMPDGSWMHTATITYTRK